MLRVVPCRVPTILLFAFCLFATAQVAAHAIIVASIPGIDAVVAGPDVPVELHYNSRIDRERSRLTLLRTDGTTETLSLAADTPADMLAATITGLTPGRYRLRWQVLSVDGHITRGDIPFRVSG